MNNIEIKELLDSLKALKIAYSEILYLWYQGNHFLDSEKSLNTYPYKVSFDELSINQNIEKIAEKYVSIEEFRKTENDVSKTVKNISVEEKTIDALKELKQASINVLNSFGQLESIDSDMLMLKRTLDSKNLYKWINSLIY